MRLLLTGGGTGGHLFPAIATAQEFQRQYPGTEVLFVGTNRKVDTKSLSAYGFSSKTITCHGVKGKNVFQLLKAVATLPLACIQSLQIIWQFKPDIILGVGGYVTGPVVAAGKSQGVPSVIHEQNSIPGLANRKLGKLANRVCLSLPGSEGGFDPEKIVYTGNPVRKKILKLAENNKESISDKKCILVLGGSQGAHAINGLVPEALAGLEEKEQESLSVIHQTGAKDASIVREAYSNTKIDAQVEPFFSEMHEIYKRADFLVSRAGATTLSEIAVLGKPAILIPYPYAADNHQEKNGQYYVEGGGAFQFLEKELTPKILQSTIQGMLQNKEEFSRMASSMKKLAFPDAPERIVECCMELIGKGSQDNV
ncbi:MAG: undecaprenyldiphospho-muramoylpentapeptide beta-N-acetylglucosaminyltransferase [Desulfobulbaceae bacterium]|nr:undecaprenyldiphospho-muramoylpentapeptide beta-N-acetylglucosaminyltransferase [Desulfobulbaceae bacterium]